MSFGSPHKLSPNPRVTLREVVIWISKKATNTTCPDVADYFDITTGYASVIVLKLYRWGYLRRWKSEVPPKIYLYALSRFGKRSARKWGKR